MGDMTLQQLADEMGVTADSLRQRVARGTLRARKVGPLWVVSRLEAMAAIQAGRGRPIAPRRRRRAA